MMANKHLAKRKRSLKAMGRRGLSLFLSMVMILSLVQIGAFAAANDLPEVTIYKNGSLVTNESTNESSYVGVKKSIEAVKGSDNEFEITLDVTTTASSELIKIPAKADVVLVLDMSGSMCKELNDGHGLGKSCATEHCALSDAVNAANTFLNLFLPDTPDQNRRVGLVAFGGDSRNNARYITRNLTSNKSDFSGTLQVASSSWEFNSKIYAYGGTPTGGAIKKATDMLAASDALYKYIILLTDGSPTLGGSQHQSAKQYATQQAQNAREAGITLYTVGCNTTSYGTKENWSELEAWMKEICTQPSTSHYVGVTSNQLTSVFQNICTILEQEINKASQGWYVEDPMSSYVSFNKFDKGYNYYKTGTNTAAAVMNDTTLRWNLLQCSPYSVDESGGVTYNHYKLKYTITVDRNEAFYTAINSSTSVPTNKTTTLHYYIKENESVKTNTIDFDVPEVTSVLPTVPYTVTYWYKDKSSGEYKQGKQDSGSGELFSTITTSSDNYSKNYYTFKDGDVGTQTLNSITSNDFNLYYDPIPASVVVKHWLVVETETDSGTVISGPGILDESTGEYVPNDVKTYPETGDSLWKGDKFTNQYFLEDCQQVDSVTDANGNTYTTDQFQNVVLTDDQTVINIYYVKSVEQRTPVDYEVHYYYRNSAWTLENGQYEVTYGDYTENSSQAIDGKGYPKDQVSFPDYSKLDTAYSLDEIRFNNKDNDDQYTVTLGSGSNVIKVYYTKAPVDNRVPAELTIVHMYFKQTISSGTPDESEDDDYFGELEKVYFEETNKKVYVGETYTASDLNEGIYDLQTKDLSITITNGSNFKEVVYLRDARVPVTVIENHYYTDYEWVVDSETGRGSWVVKSTQEQPDETGVEISGKYEGEKYIPEQKPHGYTLNSKLSDEEGRVLTSGENVFNMYYESRVGEEVVADVTVNHIYRTYSNYVDSDGNVVWNELSSYTVSEDTYYGVPGDSFTAVPQNVTGFTFTSADTDDLKVTLVGQDGQYNLYYDADEVDNQLVEANVVVQPIYKTYTTQLDGTISEEPDIVDKSEAIALDGTYYIGQKVSVPTSAYAKEGFTYDADDEENTPNATIEHLGAGDNGILLVYKHIEDDRVPAYVIVRNHYTLVTKTIDENGEYSETENTSLPISDPPISGYYVGQTFTTTGKGTSKDYQVDTRDGITQPEDTITLTDKITYVDFYWYDEVDQTDSATVEVVHHYTIQDANPNTPDIVWSEGAQLDQLGGVFYVGQRFVATPNYQNGIFDESHITRVTPSGATASTGIILESENVIHIYYVKNVDTRATTTAKVIHNYYRNAEALAAGTTEASYVENPTVRETDSYTATLRTSNSGLSYSFSSATPANYTISVSKDAANNTITISYVRADATYRVVHQYYTDGQSDGSTSAEVGAKVGEVIHAADIAKVTTYGGKVYSYSSASPASVTVTDDGSATITLRYDYTSSKPNPDPGPGSNPGDSDTSYTITVKYLDKDTDQEISKKHQETVNEYSRYDVTAYDKIDINGYTYDSTTGDPLTGSANSNKTIQVYYVKDTDIPDIDVPNTDKPDPDPSNPGTEPGNPGTEPSNPGTEPGSPSTDPSDPGSDIGDQDTPKADVPATGDNLMLWVMAAALSGMGLAWLAITGRKRKEDEM